LLVHIGRHSFEGGAHDLGGFACCGCGVRGAGHCTGNDYIEFPRQEGTSDDYIKFPRQEGTVGITDYTSGFTDYITADTTAIGIYYIEEGTRNFEVDIT
jgi:hypothetical protein